MSYTLFTLLLISMLFTPFPARSQTFATTSEVNAYEVPAVSNVLFLPGIKGSRLYENDEKVWEPSGKEDIEVLFLDEHGKSVSTEVYAKAGDILSQSFGHAFYTSFFNDLDSYEASGEFGTEWTWASAAYDWRLSLTDIVSLGTLDGDRLFYSRVSEIPYIEGLLRELAFTSETGKVTIIAHSNGGLVAKALMERLGPEAGELIDDVVFIGVPHAGAPRALAAALFGYGEALPFDSCAEWTVARFLCSLLVDRPTARRFAELSPMTYHLLPSEAYFDATRNDSFPVASWHGTTFFSKERERYGIGIESSAELYDYALAADGGREKPGPNDMNHPNVLSPSLITYARDLHARLDAWTPPLGVTVHHIVGWGRDTLSGIQFYEKPGPFGLFGGKEALYRPVFIEDGDGIVPIKSALIHDGETYQADLTHEDASHADLLELPDVREHIRDILTSNTLPVYPTHLASDPEDRRRIMFFVHGPATLGFSGSEDSYTEEQGGVEYGELGEMKYLLAPGGEPYELVIHGTEYGTFTLDILERVRNDVATTSSIVDVPVTPASIATLTIPAITGDISDLSLDYDGNGTTDLSIVPKLGEPVVIEEGLIPVVPEPPPEPEPGPIARAPEQETEHKSSHKREESLSFGLRTGTTSPQAGEPDETGRAVASDEVTAVASLSFPSSRTQTASVHDASQKIPRTLLFLLPLPLLLLLLLLAKKLRANDQTEDVEYNRREGLGEEVTENEEEDDKR